MQLKILGSGGGEGFPALFCGCEHCNAARKAGGKSLRSLSQSLIDGKLLIDLPAASHSHCLKYGLNFGEIEHLLITHTHADHYVPNILETRGDDFAHNLKSEKLHIYGNADVARMFDGVFNVFPISQNIRNGIVFHTVNPCEELQIGGYTVTVLKAKHAYEQTAFNYIIEDGKSSLLYLIDSGYPTQETLRFLAKKNKPFSCVVMDGTMGITGQYECHMNYAENIALNKKLQELGLVGEKTRVVVSHITHNYVGVHEEVEEYFSGSGIEPAYDGMELEF